MKNKKLTMLSIFIILTGGCATKQFVQEEIASSNAKITTQITESNSNINTKIKEIKEKTDQIDETLKLYQKESGELREGFINGLEMERDMLKNKLTQVEETLTKLKNSKDQQPAAPNGN